MKRVTTALIGVIILALLGFCASAAPVEIITQPQGRTVNLGSAVQFNVVASNAVSYQWQFKGANIAGGTGSELTRDNVQAADAGDYQVIVYGEGSVTSQPATLAVVPGTLVRFSIPAGGTFPGGDIQVRLFDQDKPVTVQNFLHYVVKGAYTNMFFHRLEPDFVLQGGGYFSDRDTNQLKEVTSVYSYWVEGFAERNPPFPWAVVNEYGVGPRVSNTYGTIAMAKLAGDPNSATCGWFFNLANNSTNLDTQNGGFTVFGRVTAGFEVLEYFKSLSASNGICDLSAFYASAGDFKNLPVRFNGNNENGTNYPRYSDLFHCDVSLLTEPTLDNVPPEGTILFPQAGARLTNGYFRAEGVASDNVGLARVVWDLSDGQNVWSGNANGTTDWWVNVIVPPGNYNLLIVPQDGYGYTKFTNHQFSVTTPLHVVAQGPGTATPNLDGITLQAKNTYEMTATPRAGCLFQSWSDGSNAWSNPKLRFTPGLGLNYTSNGLTMTATFISNNLPSCIAFTYPPANARLTNGAFTMRGSVARSVPVTGVSCEFYSDLTGARVGGVQEATVSTNWSVAVDLEPGSYTARVTARDAQGRTMRIAEKFKILAQIHVQKQGVGTITPSLDGQFLEVGRVYAVRATPGRGQLFQYWTDGSGFAYDPFIAFYMRPNMSLTAAFGSNYFPNVQGMYHGLYYPGTNVGASNSGYFMIKTTSLGTYSGSLRTAGKTYPLSGKFDFTGLSMPTVRPANPITLTMQLDLTNGTHLIGGWASTSNWVAGLKAVRALPKLATNTIPKLGKYVLTLPGDRAATNAPSGDGFASVSLFSTNGLTMAGVLADNTAFSHSAAVGRDGTWPVYASLSRGEGVLIGWEKFESATNCTGNLQWKMPAAATNAYYTNGVTASIASTGVLYQAPVPGTAYRISFGGGTVPGTLTGNLSVNASRQLVVGSGGTASGLKIAVDGKGLITGSFLNSATGRTLSFKGAFGAGGEGSGFILDQNRTTGFFELTPVSAK